ncbi:hypothetical protein FDUTEX481_08754 [Tolypothrix sp. PCC 7601]|nr:hypothetical protein FDUTEX481_08754 [Tolypothrix sp. PCC 7601]
MLDRNLKLKISQFFTIHSTQPLWGIQNSKFKIQNSKFKINLLTVLQGCHNYK